MAFGLLARGQAFPTTLTGKDQVLELVRSLHPQLTGRPLLRLGPGADGGYLVPDDLEGVGACFSPGVSEISGFEKDCAERGIPVFMADRSVPGPAEAHSLFYFTRKFVGVTTNDDFMTMDHWVAQSGLDESSELLLQMDIEGFEYEVFLAMSDSLLSRFRIIVAEFHSLNQLWNAPFFGLASRAFAKLLQTHVCVHIHPNNVHPAFEFQGLSIPPSAEFTFLRKDRLSALGFATQFPHALDRDTVNKPHYALPACWFGG